ncbi:hypothetical protein ISN44_As10g031460 [Arabidopsis suecica]|uniref:KIB1-4 beta-propeller domain-containing protein n=1 Tax=Arabidopsis suecica TaxID=45249 RepID=A0A8T2A4T7_ARASU|nr:hypothetical protein ISN44_As10g031360 [Arabidopsis suecica]KAG7566602.1 hypothetical protein ISN44_As10g031410 [Arabidopsis suecica]KAG7566607.1 hypothetical protein ISN44_As10g031460 [Arabidopsis suecica]
MSLLLSRLLKTPALVRHLTARSFSTSFSKKVSRTMINGDVGYIEFFKYPHDELMEDPGTIGSSQGAVATLKEGIVCLQEHPKPNVPDADRKRLSLPPLVTLPHCQTQIVTNVALSSFFPEEEDFVVAIKFLGPQLSLCRPARSSEWTNIRITDPGFFNSRVMYSKKDDMFSMPVSGGSYIRSWNLGEESKDIHKHKVKQLRFLQFPELEQSAWDLLNSCCTSEHLAESEDTCKTFLVKWYTKSNFRRKETQRFIVFKIDEKGDAEYTSNIGDLTIALHSKASAICVTASWRNRTPNIILFKGLHDSGTAHLYD